MHSRYLLPLNLKRIPSLHTDIAIVGTGVAALTAALTAAESSSVLIVTKGKAGESNSIHAQGGIAAALAEDDSPDSHLNDTLIAGADFCDEQAAKKLVTDGPEQIKKLLKGGIEFDRNNGELSLTLEGGHSKNRILHGGGDATGRTLVTGLLHRVQAHPNIQILERHYMVDLLHAENHCYGMLVLDDHRISGPAVDGNKPRYLKIFAGSVILAGGGAGQIYRETTNPEGATGDTIAAAFRAGATVRDMEFFQFHPTALYLAGARRFLISEAVRGEGGRLVDNAGETFMQKYDERGDLAPRDIVARGIVREMVDSGATNVWLSLEHLDPEMIRTRFPTIYETLKKFRLDLTKDRIPVRPAAHYLMGGIQSDLSGATNVGRLFVAGETACTGVHGANRLASNSLLEALVFGHEAGISAIKATQTPQEKFTEVKLDTERREEIPLDVWDVRNSLKSLLTRAAGVVRDADKLSGAQKAIEFWQQYVFASEFRFVPGLELRNMLLCAYMMTHGATKRTESRGAHYRTDFPNSDPHWKDKHISINRKDFE